MINILKLFLNQQILSSAFRSMFVFVLINYSSSACGQIAFEESENDEIKIGLVGNINAHVTQIGGDNLTVSWKIIELKGTGSDNIFMAYERESHNVEFDATYADLEALNTWVLERQNTKTGGKVNLGDWEVSYVQSSLGIPIFMWTGPTGNFESGINSEMRQRLMTRAGIQRAIEKYKSRKEKEEKRKMKEEERRAKRKSKSER